jgi:hypothetical protein
LVATKNKSIPVLNKTLQDTRHKIVLVAPQRRVCHKSKYSRVLEVNHNLNRHKAIAKEKRNTGEGIKKRRQGCFDVEPQCLVTSKAITSLTGLCLGEKKSKHRGKFISFSPKLKKESCLKVGRAGRKRTF